MMRVWLLSSVVFFTAVTLRADEEAGRLKALMHTFQYEMSKIRESLVSNQKFQEKQSLERVGEVLNTLERRTKGPPPKTISETPGFRVNYKLLGDHFMRTKKAFDHKEYELVRFRLAATTNFCAYCHTQLPQKNGAYAGLADPGGLKSSTLSNAEFFFIMRRFEQAL